MVRRKPEGHGTGPGVQLLKERQGRWNLNESGLLEVAGALDLPSPCTFSLACLKVMFMFMFSPRMLVGAPWDGPAGDRRGDIYRCPIGGSHNAPCAKGHLGKEMPHSSTANP